MTPHAFSEEQIHRYARHIVLPEIGGTGQSRLLSARVLVVGAGGLGSPLLLYLAAAGIGTLGIADGDVVERSNLQRQILHDEHGLGRAKTDSAAERLSALNPDVRIERHTARVDQRSVRALVTSYDLVADATDSFETRFLLGAACHAAGRTLVTGAVEQFEGRVTTHASHLGSPHPCVRCLHPEPPPVGSVASCAEGGVLGAVAGVIGAWQAAEVVKELLGIGVSLSGHLLVFDLLAGETRRLQVRRRPACPVCGETE